MILDTKKKNNPKKREIIYKVKCIYCGKIQYKQVLQKTARCECQYIHNHHKKANTHLYQKYLGIKRRCYNQREKNYLYYGARGIKMCDEWLNDFQKFYDCAISNGYKKNLTIDRIDSNGDYSPDNCRWVDNYVQANNKRNSYFITYKGETKTLAQWVKDLEIPYKTLWKRLKEGWEIGAVYGNF